MSGNEENIGRELFSHGMSVAYDPPGDGQCQFSAIADQLQTRLNSFDTSPFQVGQDVVQYLHENPFIGSTDAKLSSFLEHSINCPEWGTYILSMSRKETHGEHITLLAAACHYNVPIIVFHPIRYFLPLLSLQIN